jgi:hypothetical protein
MSTLATQLEHGHAHAVDVHLEPALEHRDRLTVLFRPILAIPHLLLVGGPVAVAFTWASRSAPEPHVEWGTGGGALGAVALVCAVIAWFAILVTGHYPEGLRQLVLFYLRWRVRAVAYLALLRDEYPPFGEGAYPAALELTAPDTPRNRLSVAFRLLLAIPQMMAIWALSVAWAVTTLLAWVVILLTGVYPVGLYDFGVGALRWTTRVEAYLLLLHDEYPPFSLT